MPDSNTESATRAAAFSPYVALRSLVRGRALTVGPAVSVREALLLLDRMRADAVVVLDESTRVPLGIITLPDVVRRIAIEGGDLQAPIAAVMTSGLITVPADGTVHQASVVMVRRGVRHLVLTEADGSYFDLISQSDLYTLPGAQSTDLVQAILAARDLRTLVGLAGEDPSLCCPPGRRASECRSALPSPFVAQRFADAAGHRTGCRPVRSPLRTLVLAGVWLGRQA
jgi:CBS domain-containing protein